MRGISWLAERTLSFLRMTLLHGVSYTCLCHRVNRPIIESDYSASSNAEVKNAWNYTSIPPIRLHSVVLKHRDNDEDGCLLGWYHPDDGGIKILWNIGQYLPDYVRTWNLTGTTLPFPYEFQNPFKICFFLAEWDRAVPAFFDGSSSGTELAPKRQIF
jgi:hypothetical protein